MRGTLDAVTFDEAVMVAYEPMMRRMAKEIAAGPLSWLGTGTSRVDTSWVDDVPIEELAQWLAASLDVP